ncbi:MAG: oxidoreductase, partial [Verrucomicrobiota bacterium]|nr:oxidoreductase [Verrucomicrobiota bacterium]
MDIFISCLTIWIAPASLLWVMLTSKWLNARAFAVGRLAEVIALVSVASATVATVLWALFAKSPVEISITGANWIGIRFDALSAIILLLVCFMGAIILRYSRNYLAGDKNQGYFFKWMCITLGAVIAMVLAPGLVQFALAWVATSLGLHKLLIYFPDRLGTL